MLPIPPRKSHPNHKIDKFMGHLNRVSMDAWDMGKHVSCDEQTIGFQSQHQDKQMINYNRRDGFQADCICENRFTYSFYVCNVAAPKKASNKNVSRLIHESFFCLTSSLMVHGVYRKEGYGIPPCILQKDIKKNEQASVRGRIKAAVLEGDPDCADLVHQCCYVIPSH